LVDFFEPHETAARLYRNRTTPGGRAIRVRLSPERNGVPVGATVLLSNKDGIQTRHIAWPATGFAFASTDVVFSSGKRGAAPRVEVRWSSGLRESFTGVTAARLNVLKEGTGHAIRAARARHRLRPALEETVAATLRSSCNPCRGSASFTVDGAAAHDARVDVFDARGRLVQSILLQTGKAVWNLRDSNGSRVAPGVYLIRSRSADSVLSGTRVVVLP
jgi:hypothetical protein